MEVDDVLALAAEQVGGLRSPVMLVGLAGFFDIGGAATAALGRLGSAEEAVTVGEIDPDPFYDFTQTRPVLVLEEGERRLCWPENRIDIISLPERDLVLTIGTEPHLLWRTFADCILTAGARLGCEMIVTVGAYADATPHTRPPRVTASTSDPRLAAALGLAPPTYQGPTGLAGVLQVALAESNLPAVSVRVGIPHYLMNTDQPTATSALANYVGTMLGLGPISVSAEERADIARARQLHDEIVANDDQLERYVAELERHYDQEPEATLPTADELGAQVEAFLDEVDAEPDDRHIDDGDGDDS